MHGIFFEWNQLKASLGVLHNFHPGLHNFVSITKENNKRRLKNVTKTYHTSEHVFQS